MDKETALLLFLHALVLFPNVCFLITNNREDTSTISQMALCFRCRNNSSESADVSLSNNVTEECGQNEQQHATTTNFAAQNVRS